jgi:hypothetical protein
MSLSVDFSTFLAATRAETVVGVCRFGLGVAFASAAVGESSR